MATTKLGFVTLLLFGVIVVLGSQVKHTTGACTKECDVRAAFIICPLASEEESKVKEVGSICTNCCVAKEQGCILYDYNGVAFCPKEQSFARKIIASIV